MGLVGADVPAIRNFVLGLKRRESEITATTARLSALIEGLNWVGPDRERFVKEWNSGHRPALVSLCSDLLDAAKKATYHANAQEAASAGHGSRGQ